MAINGHPGPKRVILVFQSLAKRSLAVINLLSQRNIETCINTQAIQVFEITFLEWHNIIRCA